MSVRREMHNEVVHPLKIAINAQLLPNSGAGGIVSALIGLIHALGKLDDGVEEYIVIVPWQEPDWLDLYLGPNQRVVHTPQPPPPKEKKPDPKEPYKRLLRSVFRPIHNVWRELSPLPIPPPPPRLWPDVPVSDGFYESLGCDVIHFPFQNFVVCSIPAIYNPHDLQHLHYPQFFTPQTIAWRERIYPAGCHFARTVVVGSHWVKQDVVRHYQMDPQKIQVIPWAAPTQAYPIPSAEFLEAMKDRYCLHVPFALYPAMTWEHKNHLRLLEALANLRDQEGLAVNIVCTGFRQPDHWPRIEEKMEKLNLNNQVKFLDLVPPAELRAIYKLAQFVVVPTLFEASSIPIF